METAQFSELYEAGNDHLDIYVRRMMAEIDQAEGTVAGFLRYDLFLPPFLNDGKIEGGLVLFVSRKQPPVIGKFSVDSTHGVQIALKGFGKIHLTGKIGAVADPDG